MTETSDQDQERELEQGQQREAPTRQIKPTPTTITIEGPDDDVHDVIRRLMDSRSIKLVRIDEPTDEADGRRMAILEYRRRVVRPGWPSRSDSGDQLA
ncbi:MAG TPA: hypothetical protein VG476_12610 [Acidimicrobiales bacterium]|nr:hypothetical protein [Acidimicrobiales bacterium]